jgi:Carboxypeptidase regulatory-like domain
MPAKAPILSGQLVWILLSGCFVLALGLAPSPAAAQGAGSATLRGTVTDASGGLLPKASVTLVNQRTKLTRSATTDGRGEYVFAALTPDAYRAQVELQGFAVWKSGEVHLSPGDSLRLATRLAVGDRTEQVTVEGERALVSSATGAREGTITADQIQNLSMVGRSTLELLRILPGVVNGEDNETVGFGSGANGFFTTVNGTRGTTISPVLDGSKIIDFGSNSSVMLNINPDMLRVGFFNLFNQAAPTRCNVRVDGVPNVAGGTADDVCDPSQGFHFTDLTKKNFGRIVTKRGHRVIEIAARFDS